MPALPLSPHSEKTMLEQVEGYLQQYTTEIVRTKTVEQLKEILANVPVIANNPSVFLRLENLRSGKSCAPSNPKGSLETILSFLIK